MRMALARSHVVRTLALAILVASCGGNASSPTQPTLELTSPSSSNATKWNITHTFASVDGPDNCWIRLQRQRLTGVVFSNLDATITRTNGTIRVDSPWFQTYTGTYSGRDFTAAGSEALPGGGTTCDGASFLQMPGISNLSGQLAEGDNSFTGAEVNSYRLTTGELVTYTWAWTGTRR
jgi:hypothetical protein